MSGVLKIKSKMKNLIKISINPFADYSKASEARKKSIIRQQKSPDKFLVAWYQLPKARIRKSISLNGDLEPIEKGIQELMGRKPLKKRQILDRLVSLEALKRYTTINLPKVLKGSSLEVIKVVDTKSVFINGVEIVISPDVIFRTQINGRSHVGAVKIHISKNNIFDSKQSKYISSLLYKYLVESVAQEDDIVSKELCLSLDIFGVRVISTPNNTKKVFEEIEHLCDELKSIWSAA